MENYIVRQAILNTSKEVVAYEVLYQQDETCLLSVQDDSAAANVIEDILTQFNKGDHTAGQVTYLTFTPNLLIRNIPKIFSHNKLVIQVDDVAIMHPLVPNLLIKYKNEGYKIALKGFEFSPRYLTMLDIIDIVKLDFSKADRSSYENIVSLCQKFSKSAIAYNVNNEEDYNLAVKMGCKIVQGSFLATAQTTQTRRINHLQSNFFQLIIAVSKEEPDIDEISSIISRDVTLAFSLIKLVNSAYFALTNRAKSVKQALVILGLGQLRHWVYLLSFKNDNNSTPTELIRISFLRANFAQELIGYVPDAPISKSEAYLLGMFSTLGVLMQTSLEEALSEIPISEEVKNGLINHEGICGALYDMILCYEQANWSGISTNAKKLNIPVNILSQKYLECVDSVDKVWKSITSVNEKLAN